ncbi:hypothetical protein BCR43DRAFT_457153 [Syncephalastrum racemosum]|uniref:Long-chain-fatty-acid--CoA ligase n=1 Tax=Syncephalastrum racemosum TaxID=13706 RepID=A0A1X2HG57_SYNRA|nr:hypothetical protein BCR43DRAFT_457153 [Syncephalastrum racemosum]
MPAINLDKQTYEVPGSRKPGQTGKSKLFQLEPISLYVSRAPPPPHTPHKIDASMDKVYKDYVPVWGLRGSENPAQRLLSTCLLQFCNLCNVGIYRSNQTKQLEESISPKVKTMYDLFNHGLKTSRDRPCLGHRPINPKTGERGPYVWQTFRQVSHRITNFGSGLMNMINHTLNEPRTKGMPIGIWANNRPEWTIADLACAAYGQYAVSLYDTLGADTVEYVINHAEIEIVICSADHIAELLKLRHKLPKLRAIVSMDTLEDSIVPAGSASKSEIIKAWAAEKDIFLVDFTALEAAGKKNRRSHNQGKPDDLAFIMYTSGTTGMPKGAMLSHRNFVSACSASYKNMGPSLDDDVTISYLPLAHIFGRLIDITALARGSRIGYFSGDITQILDDLQYLKPTIFPSVPRLLNRVYASIVQKTVEAPGVKGAIARRAVATKLANLNAGKGNTHPVWDRIIFNKVRQALGGRVRFIVTGSAPIGPDVMQFLRIALCCDMREGYGATETSASSTIHNENEYRAGHIGVPFACNELKLVDVPEMNYFSTDPFPRGELCIRGPNVFMGYYKDEEKTREALDEEGWYHSGDIATLNEFGCFVIIDRKKNIFKLAQGEYIAPEKIENVYAKDPIVAQIFLHGDSLQNSLVAIIVPDPDALNALVASKLPAIAAKKLSYQELCKNADVNKAVLDQLTRVGKKAQLRGFEFAKAIYLESNPFSIENEILTPTLKVKRPQAKAYYETQIAALYEQLASQVDPAKAKL